jgi:two-component system, cell cycle sensor histidine kinase and response regulator CckA
VRELAVLLVEDDKAVRSVIGRILMRDGFVVLSARGFMEACALLDRAGDRLSLVLTDMELPDGSGAQVAAAAREVAPGVPILCMSGAERYIGLIELPKPFGPEELRAAMRSVGVAIPESAPPL